MGAFSERVGWVACRGCRKGGRGRDMGGLLLGGVDGACKQVSTTWETAFLGRLITVSCFFIRRGALLGGQNIYLGSGYLITYIRPFSAPQGGCGGMDCSRCVWMTISQLGMFSHLETYRLLGAAGHIRHGYLHLKFYIMVARTYFYLFYSFPCLVGGRNGWMAVDGFGCRSHLGRHQDNIYILS